MATIRKFTFDLDFAEPNAPARPAPEPEAEQEPEEIIPTYSEEEVEIARQEGFEAGREEGRKAAAEATEERLLEAVEKTCSHLSEIYNTQADANSEIAKETIAIATQIAKKMFPDLNARNALGEVERVVQETLKAISDEPRVQIMVHPDLREPFTERLSTLTNRAGFEGKVFINPDPTIDLGDCRVEWSNGAAVRDVAELSRIIDEIIEHNLHGDDGEDEAPETGGDMQESAAETKEEDQVRATEDAPTAPEADMAATNSTGETEAVSESEPAPEMPVEAADSSVTSDAPMTDDGNDSAITNDDPTDTAPFTPSADPERDLLHEDNSVSDQNVTGEMGVPPIPREDPADESTAAPNEVSEGSEDVAPSLSMGDAVSPETAAAILDVQGAMDEPMDDSPGDDRDKGNDEDADPKG